MGLFDQVKDVFTTSDAERAEEAKKTADAAAARAKQAQESATRAEQNAKDLAARAAGKDPAAEAKAAEAKAAETKAAETKAAETKAAETKAAEAKAAEAKAAQAKAAQAKAASAKAAPELRTYTVRKGDTLSEIGQRFGVPWREIARLNQVKNPDLIHPGQVFRIPNS